MVFPNLSMKKDVKIRINHTRNKKAERWFNRDIKIVKGYDDIGEDIFLFDQNPV